MRRAPLLMLSLITLATLASSWASAQEKPKSAAGQRTFLGAAECVRCHLAGLPKPDDANAVALEVLGFTGLANDNWVSFEELKIWANQDKHSQAFTSLLNERSQRMGKLLGVEEIHRDKRCLACHTGFPLTAMGDDPHLLPADKIKDLRVAQGVSCEGCHAASGDARSENGVVAGWYVPHAQKESWRFLSGADKQEKFGFVNVRSEVTRARLCLSCHLGNAEQGKVVTHEMYAAGHPPLPGFELSTFIGQMPKHWLDFDKKAEGIRAEFLKRNADDTYGRETYKLDNLHQTRAMLASALVSYSENLKLAAALADDRVKSPVTKPDWPELAQFECFACHHDLKDKSWRQRRTLRGTPGRPMLRAWPTSLAKLALKAAGTDPQELDQRVAAIEQFLSTQPFGRKEQWSATAKPLTAWLDEQAAALEKKPLTRNTGLALLRDLVAIADSDFWDYDSARQLVWGAQVLRRELSSDRSDEALRAKLAALEPELGPLESLFALNLTDGRKATQQLPGSTRSREVVEVDLQKTLPPIADYDATLFRDRFRKIAEKLGAEK